VFAGRVDSLIDEAASAGVRGLITIATSTSNCADNLALARRFPHVWCSAGVHPLHSHEPMDWAVLREVGSDPRCVAWGELGLDNHYDHPPRLLQDRVLHEQLAVLESLRQTGLDKPIVVHCRESFDDLLPVFRRTSFDPSRFVFHCFTGTPDDARQVLDFGAMISFTGVVTFKNAPEVAEAARLVPLDRMMVETDAPFLPPAPVRKTWPCEPRFVMHTAKFIADLKGIPFEEFDRLTDANAERFFNLR
jgi:TatD DNase family protein